MLGSRQLCTLLLMLLISPAGLAALDVSYQFQGRGNWSIDGVGSVSNPTGTVSAIVPVGSTVEIAYLWFWDGPRYRKSVLKALFMPELTGKTLAPTTLI